MAVRRHLSRLRSVQLRRIAPMFRPHRRAIGLIGALVTVSAAAGVVPPLLLRSILDDAIPERDTALLAALVGGMVAVTVAVGIVQYVHTILVHRVGQSVMHALRVQVHDHVQRLPFAFFVGGRTGDLLSRVANDIGGLQGILTISISVLLTNATIVVAGAVAMVVLDWRLALVAAVLLPLVVIVSRLVGRRRRELTAERQRVLSRLMSRLEQTLSVSGVLLSRTTGQDARIGREFATVSSELADIEVRSRTAGQGMLTVISVALGTLPACAYLVGGLIIAGDAPPISLGTLVAFATVQAYVLGPVLSLSGLAVNVYASLAQFDRVLEILDEPLDARPAGGGRELPPARGARAVAFEHVAFAYDGREVLEDVTFTLEPGAKTALVGATGSGKTTITSLLTGLYVAGRGSVTIDGVDVRALSREALAGAVGIVSQETYLLHASVRENLRFGRPEASDADVEAAADAAQLHDVVARLPKGYDTVLGDRGYRFSGGERQRVAIARVLLRDPAILVLDEATSALDLATERHLQDALDRLATDRTTLAISHRPSAVVNADQILVLDGGRIVERGAHDELLALGGRYAELVAREAVG